MYLEGDGSGETLEEGVPCDGGRVGRQVHDSFVQEDVSGGRAHLAVRQGCSEVILRGGERRMGQAKGKLGFKQLAGGAKWWAAG